MQITLDFETYSEAGYVWTGEKWTGGGLKDVGSMNYSLHPSTEVLCMAYDRHDGTGVKLWTPNDPAPELLLNLVRNGAIVEAHNAAFEHHIWNNILTARHGWPALSPDNMRCSMAKARAYALPASLGKAAAALKLDEQKDKEGARLIRKFCLPRTPTKKDPRLRIRPEEDPEDFKKLCAYCVQDVITEAGLSSRVPDLNAEELEFWKITQKRNYQGVHVRHAELKSCAEILNQAYIKYNAELEKLTGAKATETARLLNWINLQGVQANSLAKEAADALLKREDLPDHVRQALRLRALVKSAGVRKVFTMQEQATPDGRLCDMFVYHGARTGRDTGADVQPQNLVKAGPKIQWCTLCEKPYGKHHKATCPHCGASVALFSEDRNAGDWSYEAVDFALNIIEFNSLNLVEHIFGDALLTISGCVRGLFVARDGYDFIASDYSAIEAVVAAALSGEQWRLDAFAAKKDIYIVSAARITGKGEQFYADYQKEHGAKHPDRQKIGKVAELALGYGGWLGAWRNFDKSDTPDEEIKQTIIAWREASPALVRMWGGQKPHLFGLEGMAIAAVGNAGQYYEYRQIGFLVQNDILFCRLPSGRWLTYHQPRVTPSLKRAGQLELSFMGWNSNPTMGAIGWVRINTYSGRLMENVVQAVSRDIMRDATIRLERAGYPIVLRVHDELVAEVPEGVGSVEEFERLMSELPEWATGWPVRAAGGWRGKRYRKD